MISESDKHLNMNRYLHLTKISSWFSSLFGHPYTFLSVTFLTFLWFIVWTFRGFDNEWLGIFSTLTGIGTFLLAFIIQHTADRETTVIEIKLNEIIRASKGAHNALLDLEKLAHQDLEIIQSGYAEVAAQAREELRKGKTESATAVIEVRSLAFLIDGQMDILQDPKRLDTLKRLQLIDTPPEEYLDRLTHLAKLTLGVPVALLSLVTEDRQFFKSQAGLGEPYSETRQTPLSHSFCKHVVISGKPFIVNDARDNPIVCENGAVKDLNVIAYCGIPLISQDQQNLGSFCAIDTQTRIWQKKELEILQDLAAMAMNYIQNRPAP